MERSALVLFYSGKGPDGGGRRFDELVSWTDERLEDVHDYIQWLFPLQTESAYNPLAPALSDDDIAVFKKDPEVRGRVLLAFARMLDFYGFMVFFRSGHLEIERSPDFENKSKRWLTPQNHNFLRLSRILRSLVLLDFGNHALVFLRALEGVYREHPHIVGEKTRAYWRQATTLTITVTKYSTHSAVRCGCLWVSVDQRQLSKNVAEHAGLHQSRDQVAVLYSEIDFSKKKPTTN